MSARERAESERRQAITDLMRSWREAMAPARTGVSLHWPRRSQSMTQVEAARLIEVNLRTYQRIEAGEVRPSPDVLERIVSRLCPSPRELARLLELVESSQPTDNVLPLVDMAEHAREPAWIVDAVADLRACNEAMAALLPGLADDSGNVPRWVFRHDAARETLVDYDDEARAVLGWLRHSRERSHRRRDVALIDALVHELRKANPLADRLWDDPQPQTPQFPRVSRLRRADGTVVTVQFAVAPLGQDMAGWSFMYAILRTDSPEATAT